MKKHSKLLKSIGLGVSIFLALVVYAYGFKVTKVNLDETRSPRRQEQLIRILRALAKPDLITFQQEEYTVDLPFMMPCPSGGFTPPAADKSLPYIDVTPACSEPGSEITVKGYNFQPNTTGPLTFIPPSTVKLNLGTISTNGNGEFSLTTKLPNRPDTEIQHIRAITRLSIGLPVISQTAKDTWDKIIETVFLALLATTLGTALAIPLSFFAAKNLMKGISIPIFALTLNLLLIPVGFFIGARLAGFIQQLTIQIASNPVFNLAGLLIFALIAFFGFRWSIPPEDDTTATYLLRVGRILVMILSGVLLVFSLYLLSNLTILVGKFLTSKLGILGFLGTFMADLGDILGMIMTVLTALAVAGIFASLASRLGKIISRSLPTIAVKLLNILLAALAGGLLFVLIMAGLDIFYQFDNQVVTLWSPLGLGAILGAALASLKKPKDEMPIGFVIYYLARTIFNALRSIEALIMVIVFVVWVGIGPFAGVLALSLHTIAALAKLYSEQVESILEGPIEAITATGANQLQTIIYGVIPQIIPPYISFTMYRWDINVRMSTIIGFAGGGGIGFLLIQNINLLNYRAASVQMLAIALVVASMDYLSSRLRENVI
jgi:phosphonate ABC transporter permease subunit PhnE